MTIYKTMLTLHVAAGTVALATFWMTAAMRKGSRPHILTGRTYLIAMLVVMASALPLALAAFQRGDAVLGTFLLYLVVITGSACWTAWRAIRDKHSIAQFVGPIFRVLAWLNIGAGALVLALGLWKSQVILIGLSLVGLILGPSMLRFARRESHDRRWWLVQHYASVLGGGAAAHIAFLNIGATRMVPPEWAGSVAVFAWFGPLIVSVAARVWLDRKYRMAGAT
jgi:hypothetical protein